jgi:hypothetical protein
VEEIHFLVIFVKKKLPIKRYNYFLKKIWMNNTNIFDLTQILISKKFEKKLSSKVLF